MVLIISREITLKQKESDVKSESGKRWWISMQIDPGESKFVSNWVSYEINEFK